MDNRLNRRGIAANKGSFGVSVFEKVFMIFVVMFALISCSSSVDKSRAATENLPELVFATWSGLGPDKWASIWLIQRHVNSETRVILLPEGSDGSGLVSEDVIFFDVPDSDYLRDTDTSTFQQIREAYDIRSEKALWVNRIIHDIDINLWMPDQEPFSAIAERGFRELQNRYGRDAVPYECYIKFFDRVAAHSAGDVIDEEALLPDENCGKGAVISGLEKDVVVPEIPIADLFDAMRAGSKVVFIDVREPGEFAENHIPGATNIQIRNADGELAESLQEADLVISYCVKDFRGFEMAKKLKELGVDNSAILKPFGIKGWLSSGLPVVRGLDPEAVLQAEAQLQECVARSGNCNAAL